MTSELAVRIHSVIWLLYLANRRDDEVTIAPIGSGDLFKESQSQGEGAPQGIRLADFFRLHPECEALLEAFQEKCRILDEDTRQLIYDALVGKPGAGQKKSVIGRLWCPRKRTYQVVVNDTQTATEALQDLVVNEKVENFFKQALTPEFVKMGNNFTQYVRAQMAPLNSQFAESQPDSCGTEILSRTQSVAEPDPDSDAEDDVAADENEAVAELLAEAEVVLDAQLERSQSEGGLLSAHEQSASSATFFREALTEKREKDALRYLAELFYIACPQLDCKIHGLEQIYLDRYRALIEIIGKREAFFRWHNGQILCGIAAEASRQAGALAVLEDICKTFIPDLVGEEGIKFTGEWPDARFEDKSGFVAIAIPIKAPAEVAQLRDARNGLREQIIHPAEPIVEVAATVEEGAAAESEAQEAVAVAPREVIPVVSLEDVEQQIQTQTTNKRKYDDKQSLWSAAETKPVDGESVKSARFGDEAASSVPSFGGASGN